MHLFYLGAAIHGTMLSIENVAHNSFISFVRPHYSFRFGFPFVFNGSLLFFVLFLFWFPFKAVAVVFFPWQKILQDYSRSNASEQRITGG